MTEKKLNQVCPLCNSSAVARKHPISRDPWNVVECAGCGFVYLQNPPTYEELTEDLAWEKIYESDATRRATERPTSRKVSRGIRKFRKHVLERIVPRRSIGILLSRFAKPGNVLDIGCGTGGAMSEIDECFIPWGIEISKDLANKAKSAMRIRGGDVIHAPALEGLARFEANRFSAIIMRSYLEHEVNPHKVLIGASRLLRPAGIVIIKVPNFSSLNAYIMREKWCGVRLPAHVNYFRSSDLKHLVEQSHLSVLHFGKVRYRPVVSDNMWMVAAKTTN